MDNDDAPTSKRMRSKKVDEAGKKLKKLRLEAIFHPKFENESLTDSNIRNEMTSKVSAGLGCLEVTLKHSGSLLLWSGGQRYYSKNSTHNVFTAVGEMLLRQHFARAWWSTPDTMTDDDDSSDHGIISQLDRKYKECSDYVLRNRLTLAFELVTSLLGNHGDKPNHDFLILTAVANLNTGTFYSTMELVSFAQMFRLPHNDSWVFLSSESTGKLFDMYDTCRETGLADFISSYLTSITDAHGYFQSMYPHTIFQGNVLEGLVIRYVPFEKQFRQTSVSSRDNEALDMVLVDGKIHRSERDHYLSQASKLFLESERIKTIFCPHHRPSIYELVQGLSCRIPPLYTTNLRLLPVASDNLTEAEFPKLLAILENTDSSVNRRKIQGFKSAKSHLSVEEKFDVLMLVKELKQIAEKHSQRLDEETTKIADLLLKLESLALPKELKIVKENLGANGTEQNRWLCMVHILHDDSFQKYFKSTKPGDLLLFRGFCLQLIFDDNDSETYDDVGSLNNGLLHQLELSALQSSPSSSGGTPQQSEDSRLMLKMKFLPYMVRTFICRNGLSLLARSGPFSFDQFALQLFNKWGISQQSILYWYPFVSAWGKYAFEELQNTCQIDDSSKTIYPLSGSSYLDHLHHFSTLYYGGKCQFMESRLKAFVGLLVVAGINKEEMNLLSIAISQEIRGSRIWNDIDTLTETHILQGGYICGASIEQGLKILRLLGKSDKIDINLLLIGCSSEEINTAYCCDDARNKKLIALSKKWRTSKFKSIIEIQRSKLVGDSNIDETSSNFDISKISAIDEFNHLKAFLIRSTESQEDEKGGIIIFFPQIPGTGKSSLCSLITPETLNSDIDSTKNRTVIIRSGDKVKEKYYPLVTREKLEDPSSVYVMDKNTPPNVWRTIGEICSKSRSTAIPILPAFPALTTTKIESEISGRCQHETFPFSLHYLAVNMARVLKRPKGSHAGKLDLDCDRACMIVVMFYTLYRNIAAENISLIIRDKVGYDTCSNPIEVPFFIENLPDLPGELDDALRNAISLQGRLDAKSESDLEGEVSRTEQILRNLISRHREFLEKLTVTTEISAESLIAQLAERIRSLDTLGLPTQRKFGKLDSVSFIDIASIDVDVAEVYNVIKLLISESDQFRSFLETRKILQHILGDNPDEECQYRFISRSHVTMAHHSAISQLEMRCRFGSLTGKNIPICVHGVLYDPTIAALRVSVGSTCIGHPPIPVPNPINKFAHVTLWCAPGVDSVESNELPSRVCHGTASELNLREAVMLNGTFRFWTR